MNSTTNCYNFFRSRFSSDYHRVFLECEDGNSYSFADLETISARFVRFFQTLGLKAGDRVLVQAEKSPEVIFLYAACLRSGLIFIPLNTQRFDIGAILNDATPDLVVCSPELEHTFRAHAGGSQLPLIKTLGQHALGSLVAEGLKLEPNFEVYEPNRGDVACIFYTSGTTGKPKGVVHGHEQLISATLSYTQILDFTDRDVFLHAINNFGVVGYFFIINLALYNACRVLFLRNAKTDLVLDKLPRTSVFTANPHMYESLLRHVRLDEELCKNVRLFGVSGAPLSKKTFATFKDRTGKAISERWGMTEAMAVTYTPLGCEKAGSCGKIFPGVAIRVTDKNGAVLEEDQIGFLEIKGPNVCNGYWGNETETNSAFRPDGYFITGDVGRVDADGYVWLTGRAKDVIYFQDLHIFPTQIEAKIDAIQGVGSSAVFGVPHPLYGECAVAVIKTALTRNTLTKSTILRILRDNCPDAQVPRGIYFVDEIPQDEAGKVDKKKLREIYKDLFRDQTK